MRISTHAKITKEKCGFEAVDIHEWIDAFFDHERFNDYLRTGVLGDFNPYNHRVHRHCQEALDECLETFKDTYSEDIIKIVFESHIREDYYGYYPSKQDFEDPDFHDKYHTS